MRIVLVILSGITFLAFGWDKAKAKACGRRIPEATLFLLCVLGGTPGALLAMAVFNHKTRKSRFRTLVFAIAIAQALALTAWWMR